MDPPSKILSPLALGDPRVGGIGWEFSQIHPGGPPWVQVYGKVPKRGYMSPYPHPQNGHFWAYFGLFSTPFRPKIMKYECKMMFPNCFNHFISKFYGFWFKGGKNRPKYAKMAIFGQNRPKQAKNGPLAPPFTIKIHEKPFINQPNIEIYRFTTYLKHIHRLNTQKLVKGGKYLKTEVPGGGFDRREISRRNPPGDLRFQGLPPFTSF